MNKEAKKAFKDKIDTWGNQTAAGILITINEKAYHEIGSPKVHIKTDGEIDSFISDDLDVSDLVELLSNFLSDIINDVEEDDRPCLVDIVKNSLKISNK